MSLVSHSDFNNVMRLKHEQLIDSWGSTHTSSVSDMVTAGFTPGTETKSRWEAGTTTHTHSCCCFFKSIYKNVFYKLVAERWGSGGTIMMKMWLREMKPCRRDAASCGSAPSWICPQNILALNSVCSAGATVLLSLQVCFHMHTNPCERHVNIHVTGHSFSSIKLLILLHPWSAIMDHTDKGLVCPVLCSESKRSLLWSNLRSWSWFNIRGSEVRLWHMSARLIGRQDADTLSIKPSMKLNTLAAASIFKATKMLHCRCNTSLNIMYDGS